jgi:hypothetical protein
VRDRPAEEHAVSRLRELHRSVAEDERPRAALLLGFALADEAERTSDATLAAEALGHLDAAAVADTPAFAARRGRLAAIAAPAVRPTAGSIDPTQIAMVREAARAAGEQLASTPPGHPARGRLLVLAGFEQMMGLVNGQRWRAEHDELLKELRSLPPADPTFDPIVRGVAAMFRAQRWLAGDDSAAVQELRDVIAELESASDRMVSAGPVFAELEGMLRSMAGMLLVRLVSAEAGGGAGPLPMAAVAAAARARAHLSRPGGPFEDSARAALDALDALEGVAPADRPLRMPPGVGAETFHLGGDLPRVMDRAQRARLSGRTDEVDAAIDDLRRSRAALAAGHPGHAMLLAALANLLAYRAARTQSPDHLTDALDAGVQAVRAAAEPSAEVAAHLVGALSIALMIDQRAVPYQEADDALSAMVVSAPPDDRLLRATLLTGIGSARAHRWRQSRAEADRRAVRETLDEAERLLGPAEPDDRWLGTAWPLMGTNSTLATLLGDPDAAAAAIRMIDRLEALIRADPGLAARIAPHLAPAAVTGMGLTIDADGLLQALAGMRRMLGLSPMTSFLNTPGDLNTQVHTVMETMRAGGNAPFDIGAAARVFMTGGTDPTTMPAMLDVMRRMDRGNGGPIDVSALMDAGMKAMLGGDSITDAFTTVLGGTVPPPAPTEPDVALRANAAIADAEALLGLDGSLLRRRHPLDPQERPPVGRLLRTVELLRAALTGGSVSARRRRRVHGLLGLCLAELAWQDTQDPALPGAEAGRTVVEAVEQLRRSIGSDEHREPAVERADLLDVLARCQHRLGDAAAAEDAARGALRELRRCVLVEIDFELGLTVAERATPVVARAVDWNLAAGRIRAALEIAELGRGLVLASVVVAGQVGQLLADIGAADAATAWRSGTPEGRAEGFTAASATIEGQAVLTPPTLDQLAAAVLHAGGDAVVYLVPPAGPGSSGHALLLRSDFTVDEVELPDLRDLAPLRGYTGRFAAALDRQDPGRAQPGGFQATDGGPDWVGALDEVTGWAYGTVIAPLLARTRTWGLDREPRLVLVPVGELVAVPFAAAWTDDGTGGRRYAMQDLLLWYAGSGRLLVQTARRSRPTRAGRAVFAVDPTGELHFSRLAARRLADQYDDVAWYGRRATGGPATTEVVLNALAGPEHGGATLLQLTTHGRMAPTPGLQTQDGWLSLDRLLGDAWNRPADAAGGLVVTTACLTDSSTARFDQGVTMAAALLAAGSTGVVGTRWPIDDPAAAVFTYLLHQRLRTYEPAQALRRTQLDLAGDADLTDELPPELAKVPRERLSHPAAWAGYVHYGS